VPMIGGVTTASGSDHASQAPGRAGLPGIFLDGDVRPGRVERGPNEAVQRAGGRFQAVAFWRRPASQ
jgi:hypothetical protein